MSVIKPIPYHHIINLYCRAVAPTPAGQAMAGPVFSLHLAGLTCNF